MKNFAPKPPSLQRSGPKPPGGLSPEAKRWWRKIVSDWELDQSALLILEHTLQSLDRLREAQVLLAKDGITVKDRWGQIKQHPATLIERDSKAGLLRGLKALNLAIEPLQDGIGRPPGS